jgi:hypothetical protein
MPAKPKPKNGNGKRAPGKSGARSRPVSQPIARGAVTMVRQQPRQVTLANGDIRISHRELLGPVTARNASSAAFLRDLFVQINPGNPGLAPWLAGVSPQYESYRFEALSFDYVPIVPTTYAGQVWLSADYDPADSAPTTAQAFSVTPSSVSCPIHQRMTMVCRPADLQKRSPSYFVRSVGSGTDSTATTAAGLRALDAGNFFTAVEGAVNAAGAGFSGVCGNIWVRYTVRLSTPQLGLSAAGAFLAKEDNNLSITNGVPVQDSIVSLGARALTEFDSNLLTNFEGNNHGLSSFPTVQNYSGPILAMVSAYLKNTTGAATNIAGLATYLTQNGVQVPSKISSMADHSDGALGAFGAYLLDAAAGDYLTAGVEYIPGATANVISQKFLDILPINPRLRSHLRPLFEAASAVSPLYWKGAGTQTAANPLGTIEFGSNTLGCITYATGTGQFTVPAGKWIMHLYAIGTVLVVPTFSPAAGTTEYSESIVNAGGTEALSTLSFHHSAATTVDISFTSVTTLTDVRVHWHGVSCAVSDITPEPI